MLSSIRALVAMLVMPNLLGVAAPAIADDGIFAENVREVFLVRGDTPSSAFAFFAAYETNPDVPRYTVYPGSGFPPGLDLQGISGPVGNGSYSYAGVRMTGTPTATGLYSYRVDEIRPGGTTELTLNVYVLKDHDHLDAATQYTYYTRQAQGYATFYWAALRGYFLGLGVEDESLAYYSYYSSLAGYYYVYYASGNPQYAAYYYYYYHGHALYYYFAYNGDNASALYFYGLYMSYADQQL